MRLTQLLEGLIAITEKEAQLISEIDVTGLALDSRIIKAGDLFIALSGAKQHGLVFAEIAINKGACAVLFDPAEEGRRLAEHITEIPVVAAENLNRVLGQLAARFYDAPFSDLEVIGITGTNGKTSCSQFLGQLLDDCGIIGTLGWGEWGRLNRTVNTTPDALTVQQILATFVNEKKKTVAMEVSSHGLDQGRVNGVHFKGAVYTNISRDHLDYHGTMDEYLKAKLKLLQMPGLQFTVINLDDPSCETIAAATPESVRVWGVSAKGKCCTSGETVKAENLQLGADGIGFEANWRGQKQNICAPLYGDFNVENVLCVLAAMLALGYSLTDSATKLASLKPVVGRMERCGGRGNDMNVFVDYAHTPDALYRVLESLRKHCAKNLWVVFGCGGNRDAGKRPQMGGIAEQWADRVIVTDDNPRFESNTEIAREIMAGCKLGKAIVIQDRKRAIQHAIASASEQDCIVIAGKGHENYQEINGIQYPFNDKHIAEDALNSRFGTQ